MKLWYACTTNLVDGNRHMPLVLGNKGASLSGICEIGLKVPSAFILPTEISRHYYKTNTLPPGTSKAIRDGIEHIDNYRFNRFNVSNFMLSIRSSPCESMPGMMDTILNVLPDPEQVESMVKRVLDSWNNERSRAYRKLNGISDEHGTAVVVQLMVFGDLDKYSGTGVVFSRNPINGDARIFGEWLPEAQGDDLVSGLVTPEPIDSMEYTLSHSYQRVTRACSKLEALYKDAQDIEFTIQGGDVYILQTRTAKRTAEAALKIAVSMVGEKLITIQDALSRVTDEQIKRVSLPKIEIDVNSLTEGLPASPGVVTGAIALSSEAAVALNDDGQNVILVRKETSPKDILGINAANGILTSIGGMTSHAAIIARDMDKPCVVGCSKIVIDQCYGTVDINGSMFRTGDIITIDGSTGAVYLGYVPTVPTEQSNDIKTFLRWKEGPK